MNVYLIPRINWLRFGNGHRLIAFICPLCRMFSIVYDGCSVSIAGLTATRVRCVHYVASCEFNGRIRLEAWEEKNREIYK